MRIWVRAWPFAATLGACLVACDSTKPLVPANHDPVVLQPLQAFPTTIGDADSAIVKAFATDADGDTVVYDWYSSCLKIRYGDFITSGYLFNTPRGNLVVYPGCSFNSVDTGWVRCYVRDRRGGGAYAGLVQIVLQH